MASTEWDPGTAVGPRFAQFSATRNPLSKLFFRDSRFETPLSTEERRGISGERIEEVKVWFLENTRTPEHWCKT